MGYVVCLAAILALTSVSAASALPSLSANPANRLLSRGIDPLQYDPATKCNGGKVWAGTMAMVSWLQKNASGVNWGEYRCEKWGKDSASLHSEGRAIDWHPSSSAAGRALVKLLLAPDKAGNAAALARRMGVQGLIFDCKAWFGNWDGKLGNYSYCYGKDGKRKKGLNVTQAHMDHVHLELNRRGAAKKTTFWSSTVTYPTQTQAPTPSPVRAPAPAQDQGSTDAPSHAWQGGGHTGGGQYDNTGGSLADEGN